MPYEQRQFRRIETYIVMDVETPDTPPERLEAVCLDISTGGMKVLLDKELTVGQHVTVLCTIHRRRDGDFFLESDANVVRIDKVPKSNDFSVGLEFKHLPLEAEEEISRLTDS